MQTGQTDPSSRRRKVYENLVRLQSSKNNDVNLSVHSISIDNDADEDETALSQIVQGQQFFQDLDLKLKCKNSTDYVKELTSLCTADVNRVILYREHLLERVRSSPDCPPGRLLSRKNTTKTSKLEKYARDCYVLHTFAMGERTGEIHEVLGGNPCLNDSINHEQDRLEPYTNLRRAIQEPDVIAILLRVQTDVSEIKSKSDKCESMLIEMKETLSKVTTTQTKIENALTQLSPNIIGEMDHNTVVNVALPQEVYSIWEAYPWRFGETFCILKAFVMEMTAYSSVLTITGFTIERYFAICRPMTIQRCCHVTRAVRCIMIIWFLSVISALPYAIHTRVFHYLHHPGTGAPIKVSLVCNIPLHWTARMLVVFQFSTFVYFVLPMVVISVFYVMIGLKLRESALTSVNSSPQYGKATATRARRAVLKMLVAVVVAFFICWAPFHAQRLMTLYIKEWTEQLLELQSHLFYVSGILYFLSSTVNPILYNLLSRKFRRAFKRTLCRCLFNINSLPTFYKLKAKFINNELVAQSSDGPHNHPYNIRHSIRLVPMRRHDDQACENNNAEALSTLDTLMNRSSRSSSCSTSHAHSDGGLHYLCRHKRCLHRRKSQLMACKDRNVASHQDIDALKKADLAAQRKRQLTLDVEGTSGDELESLEKTSSDRPVLRIMLQI